jgi:hypothetical protein
MFCFFRNISEWSIFLFSAVKWYFTFGILSSFNSVNTGRNWPTPFSDNIIFSRCHTFTQKGMQLKMTFWILQNGGFGFSASKIFLKGCTPTTQRSSLYNPQRIPLSIFLVTPLDHSFIFIFRVIITFPRTEFQHFQHLYGPIHNQLFTSQKRWSSDYLQWNWLNGEQDICQWMLLYALLVNQCQMVAEIMM